MALPPCFLVFVGGRHSQRLGSSPTLGSLGPSHQLRHKSRVSLRGPPCAHDVSDTPHGEVRDNENTWVPWISSQCCWEVYILTNKNTFCMSKQLYSRTSMCLGLSLFADAASNVVMGCMGRTKTMHTHTVETLTLKWAVPSYTYLLSLRMKKNALNVSLEGGVRNLSDVCGSLWN